MKKTSILIAMFAVIAAAPAARAQMDFDGTQQRDFSSLRESVISLAQGRELSIPVPERALPEAAGSSFSSTISAEKNLRVY